ncbi:hypothetical protein QQG55_17320 [Brugia pahangi]
MRHLCKNTSFVQKYIIRAKIHHSYITLAEIRAEVDRRLKLRYPCKNTSFVQKYITLAEIRAEVDRRLKLRYPCKNTSFVQKYIIRAKIHHSCRNPCRSR